MRHARNATAAEFFLSTVRPTAEEFLEDLRNIRRGRLAAIVLYHMADHAALEGYAGMEMKKRLDALQEELIAACPDFALIRDIADASKHARLHVRTTSPRQITTAQQIARPPGGFGAPFGTAVFAEASWVMVTLDDGQVRPLAGIVRSVLQMWENKLNPVGPKFQGSSVIDVA
jgi:hypothetical protein